MCIEPPLPLQYPVALPNSSAMVIFAEDGRVRAEYFDSEGHVIRYEVQSRAPGTLVFLSEARPGTPRFRLAYTASGPEKIALTFEIAPPGATDFRPYISARLRREH